MTRRAGDADDQGGRTEASPSTRCEEAARSTKSCRHRPPTRGVGGGRRHARRCEQHGPLYARAGGGAARRQPASPRWNVAQVRRRRCGRQEGARHGAREDELPTAVATKRRPESTAPVRADAWRPRARAPPTQPAAARRAQERTGSSPRRRRARKFERPTARPRRRRCAQLREVSGAPRVTRVVGVGRARGRAAPALALGPRLRAGAASRRCAPRRLGARARLLRSGAWLGARRRDRRSLSCPRARVSPLGADPRGCGASARRRGPRGLVGAPRVTRRAGGERAWKLAAGGCVVEAGAAARRR